MIGTRPTACRQLCEIRARDSFLQKTCVLRWEEGVAKGLLILVEKEGLPGVWNGIVKWCLFATFHWHGHVEIGRIHTRSMVNRVYAGWSESPIRHDRQICDGVSIK